MRSIALLAATFLLACSAANRSTRYEYPTLRSFSLNEQYVMGESRLVPGENLFDALRRSRPSLLRVRGTQGTPSDLTGVDAIGVYVNGTFAGGIETLQTISARDVASVRRLRGVDASNRFAGRFRDGVIEVQLVG